MTPDDHAKHDLRSLREAAVRIRETPEGDDDDAVRERMALRAEWNNMVSWIARVESAARTGLLTEPTLVELGEVAIELRDLLPTMTKRRYHLPDADALDHAARRAISARNV
jgi:hypothetical protein